MQSQMHGFTFENSIRSKIFNLPKENNSVYIHDIHHSKNILNMNENVSIKTTGSNTICCGDILRFYDYDFLKTNTIIVIKYDQVSNEKIIKNIYEIDYNKECHKLLFGELTYNKIKDYDLYIKNIPKGKVSYNEKNKYLKYKKELEKDNNCLIKINPKVDSKYQRRVQCSISNFEDNLYNFIKYKSPYETPNMIRGNMIELSIKSHKRVRNSKTK
jgi:hypothetical protein|tara:strand:+ start:494 stop:1138 length:645 start_codon:yes stop_codon:yes gene_type:complete